MRVAAGLTVAGLLAGGLVGLAPTSASAAYTTVVGFHGARMQACRLVGDGDARVRFRLDNRDGRHAHNAGVTRFRGSEVTGTFVVRAAAGRVSSSRTFTVRGGDRLSAFVGEESQGAAEDFARADLPRCGA